MVLLSAPASARVSAPPPLDEQPVTARAAAATSAPDLSVAEPKSFMLLSFQWVGADEREAGFKTRSPGLLVAGRDSTERAPIRRVHHAPLKEDVSSAARGPADTSHVRR